MVVAFRSGSGCCLVHFVCCNLFISSIDDYTCREVFGSLNVYFIFRFCIGFIVLVVFYLYYYGTSRMQCFCNF